jgi:hypothetical protein
MSSLTHITENVILKHSIIHSYNYTKILLRFEIKDHDGFFLTGITINYKLSYNTHIFWVTTLIPRNNKTM